MTQPKSAAEKAREYASKDFFDTGKVVVDEPKMYAWLAGHAEAVREITDWLESNDGKVIETSVKNWEAYLKNPNYSRLEWAKLIRERFCK